MRPIRALSTLLLFSLCLPGLANADSGQAGPSDEIQVTADLLPAEKAALQRALDNGQLSPAELTEFFSARAELQYRLDETLFPQVDAALVRGTLGIDAWVRAVLAAAAPPGHAPSDRELSRGFARALSQAHRRRLPFVPLDFDTGGERLLREVTPSAETIRDVIAAWKAFKDAADREAAWEGAFDEKRRLGWCLEIARVGLRRALHVSGVSPQALHDYRDAQLESLTREYVGREVERARAAVDWIAAPLYQQVVPAAKRGYPYLFEDAADFAEFIALARRELQRGLSVAAPPVALEHAVFFIRGATVTGLSRGRGEGVGGGPALFERLVAESAGRNFLSELSFFLAEPKGTVDLSETIELGIVLPLPLLAALRRRPPADLPSRLGAFFEKRYARASAVRVTVYSEEGGAPPFSEKGTTFVAP